MVHVRFLLSVFRHHRLGTLMIFKSGSDMSTATCPDVQYASQPMEVLSLQQVGARNMLAGEPCLIGVVCLLLVQSSDVGACLWQSLRVFGRHTQLNKNYPVVCNYSLKMYVKFKYI